MFDASIGLGNFGRVSEISEIQELLTFQLKIVKFTLPTYFLAEIWGFALFWRQIFP